MGAHKTREASQVCIDSTHIEFDPSRLLSPSLPIPLYTVSMYGFGCHGNGDGNAAVIGFKVTATS